MTYLQLLSERTKLLSEVDDLKQITEAAKRERVLAIDEKDQLLREYVSVGNAYNVHTCVCVCVCVRAKYVLWW